MRRVITFRRWEWVATGFLFMLLFQIVSFLPFLNEKLATSFLQNQPLPHTFSSSATAASSARTRKTGTELQNETSEQKENKIVQFISRAEEAFDNKLLMEKAEEDFLLMGGGGDGGGDIAILSSSNKKEDFKEDFFVDLDYLLDANDDDEVEDELELENFDEEEDNDYGGDILDNGDEMLDKALERLSRKSKRKKQKVEQKLMREKQQEMENNRLTQLWSQIRSVVNTSLIAAVSVAKNDEDEEFLDVHLLIGSDTGGVSTSLTNTTKATSTAAETTIATTTAETTTAAAILSSSASICTVNYIGPLKQRTSTLGCYWSPLQAGFLVSRGAAENSESLPSIAGATNKYDSSSVAICEFQKTPFTWFPSNTMEQLYRCISWWLYKQDEQRKQSPSPPQSQQPIRPHNNAVLLFKGVSPTKFQTAMFTLLSEMWNVTVLHQKEELQHEHYYDGVEVVSMNLQGGHDVAPYGFLDPKHAQSFGQQVIRYYQNKNLLTAARATKTRRRTIPRIAILNRPDSEYLSILNVDELKEVLLTASRNQTLFHLDPEIYVFKEIPFRNMAVADHIQLFANVDIIISPHQYHLWAIPFLNVATTATGDDEDGDASSSCGTLLEFFPKNYCNADYFGSLASGTGIRHAYFHLTSDKEDLFLRSNRRQNMCPPLEPVVEGVLQLVEQWKKCMADTASANNNPIYDDAGNGTAKNAVIGGGGCSQDPQTFLTAGNETAWHLLKEPITLAHSTDFNISIETTCILDPIKQLDKRTSTQGYYPDFNDKLFLVGDGLKPESLASSNYAVCEFQHTGFTHHFVHGMEQFYRCVSWWFSNPTKNPVLLFDIKNKLHRGQRFYADFFAALVDVFHVTIVAEHPAPSVKQDLDIRDGLAPFGLGGPHIAQQLSQNILRFYKLGNVLQDAAKRRETLIPRVAILNRDTSIARSLLNANDLQEALLKASVRGNSNNSSSLFSVAPVTYFEHASFLEQVTSFASMDIVISPHGAQLAGIPFMPPCGSVLELYPKNYWIPHYFGSLASGCGLAHSYFHLSEEKDQYKGASARDKQLCAPTKPIVKAVKGLIHDWKKMCHFGETFIWCR